MANIYVQAEMKAVMVKSLESSALRHVPLEQLCFGGVWQERKLDNPFILVLNSPVLSQVPTKYNVSYMKKLYHQGCGV